MPACNSTYCSVVNPKYFSIEPFIQKGIPKDLNDKEQKFNKA